MSETISIVKKWGNSLGIVISKELANKENLKPTDKVILDIKKSKSLKDLFGTLKTKKTAQELKDEEREGWE